MNNRTGINLKETKLVFFTLGNSISAIEYYNPLIFKTVSRVGKLPKAEINDLLNFVTPSMILNLFQNLPHSWPFFEIYLHLDLTDLVVHLEKLHNLCFKKD